MTAWNLGVESVGKVKVPERQEVVAFRSTRPSPRPTRSGQFIVRQAKHPPTTNPKDPKAQALDLQVPKSFSVLVLRCFVS